MNPASGQPKGLEVEQKNKGIYISTDHIRVPLRTELVMMKLCQRYGSVGSCGLCIFTDSWGGWSTDVSAVEVSVTGIGLLQSAQRNTLEGWRSYIVLFDSVLRSVGVEAAESEEC